MAKQLWVFLLFFSLNLLHGKDILLFIPGWYSEWINYSAHREILQKTFPDTEIIIYKWDSNRLWKNAKISAESCVDKICRKISASSTPERYIIAGHSLGGRIAINSAAILAKKKIKVKRIILLGTAAAPEPEELTALQQVSSDPVINIFCTDDNMLKLYIRQEQDFPLGFTGISKRIANFRQYRMPVVDHDIKLGKITLPQHRSTESFRETAAHLAVNYLQCLRTALNDKMTEFYIDYPALEKLAARNSVIHDKLPGFRQTDEFDSWVLGERKIKTRFRITAPSGKHFYYTSKQSAVKNFNAVKQRLLNRKTEHVSEKQPRFH